MNHNNRRYRNTRNNRDIIFSFPRISLFNLVPQDISSFSKGLLFSLSVIFAMCVTLERNIGFFGLLDSLVTVERSIKLNEHQTYIVEGFGKKVHWISDSNVKGCVILSEEVKTEFKFAKLGLKATFKS